jgi:hypothetical protein
LVDQSVPALATSARWGGLAATGPSSSIELSMSARIGSARSQAMSAARKAISI